MRTEHRARRQLSTPTFMLMRPVMRYSYTRDAYVLRGVGNRWGPVVKRPERAASEAPQGEQTLH